MTERRTIPEACVDCGAELEAARRRMLARDRTPLTHFRCTPCEDRFLTVLDPARLAVAVSKMISRE